jgi:hypothetical protein
MYEYEVSFVYDYATIVVSNNLARDYEHALKEAEYWMELSGVGSTNPPIDIQVEVRE